ncbi:MAG: GNAT family N-acetyltransferase [Chloroflexota bacterium]
MNSIASFEELSLNAWPAPRTLCYDGWVLRFAGGYTRRANAIYPIYPSMLPLEEKIAVCERVYGGQGLPVVFKMTDVASPPALDGVLAGQGYRVEAHTSVQVLDLSRFAGGAMPEGFHFATDLTQAWFDTFCRLSGTPDRHHAAMRQILGLIVPARCFALLRVGEKPLACGLAVLQHGFVGIFDIVVAAEQRGKGYGRRIMDGLLAWGKAHGAQASYLQVMDNNPVALRLYAALGYRKRYPYWYRVRDQVPAA